MSEHGSAKSADTKFRINTHDYFVPAIVIVVLCILIVSTFHEEQADNHAGGLADTTQADKPAASQTAITKVPPKALDAADASKIANNSTAASAQRIPGRAALATQTVVDAKPADTDVMAPARTSFKAGNDRAVSNKANQTASTVKPASDENISQTRDPAGTGLVIDDPVADEDQVKRPMQDQERRLYQEAMQARKAHMMKMLEYRAEVRKRIEQDRRDLYRYRHNGTLQRREYRDRYRDSLEQARNGADDIPI